MTSVSGRADAAVPSPADGNRPKASQPADLRLVGPALAAWGAAALALDATGTVVAVACAVASALAAVALFLAARQAAVHRSRPRGATPMGDGPTRNAPTGDGPTRNAPTGDGPTGTVPTGTAPTPGATLGPPAAAATAWATTLAGVLLCAVAGAASAGLHAADLRRGPLPALAGRYAQVSADVKVTGDPHPTRPKVRGSQRAPEAVVFTADVTHVTAPDGTVTATRTPVLVVVQQRPRQQEDARGPETGPAKAAARPLAKWRELLPSTHIRVRARPAPPLPPSGPIAAVLRVTADTGPHRLTGPTVLQRVAGDLRAGLRRATDGLDADARALLPGLVVGDTSRVPSDLQDAFDATDLTHLLAVSGSNLMIMLALLIGPPHLALRAERRGLAPRLGLSLRHTALMGGAVTLAFVIVCRPDPSVLRAAACGVIVLLAIGTGRRRGLLPALAAAVLLLVLYDPWLARSYGFLLSVLATGALLTIAPRWSAALRRRRVPPRLAEALAASAAAQVVCAPVGAVLAARVGLVGVPCNLLAEPAVAAATVLGFLALATAPVIPVLAHLLAWCAGWPALWIAGLARTGASLPGAELDWPGGWPGGLLLGAVIAILLPFGRRALRRPWLCVLCALLLLLVVCRPVPLVRVLTGWPPPDWRAVACDVGQGDGLVLAAGDGTAVVVDTGPEPRAIDRCLSDLGVRRVALLVLTHFHADHVDGLSGVLRGRAVGAIQTTPVEEPPGQAAFVRRQAAAAHVPVIHARAGERRRLGPLSWTVLWPITPTPPDTSPTATSPYEGTPPPPDTAGSVPLEPNDASVTLLVRSAGLSLLLLGDLEPHAQQALLAAYPDLGPVDVLKVAHHGSGYQDPDLIRRLAPRLALVSVGAGNPYGHPAPRTLGALRSHGTTVLRTDADGAVAVLGTAHRPSAVVRGRGFRRRRRPPTRWCGRRRARACTSAGRSSRCRCS
ncbi:ComEC/Rec2 family competence protein [Streptomyces sp. NPDC003077]|uniref:ComEC/Rec2 family competence protein n=1 Tax=Streptomyces sp. NPDC003077 TaxID=3154443 RepID=UPI0033A31AE0